MKRVMPVLERLKKRFRIRKVVFVRDRRYVVRYNPEEPGKNLRDAGVKAQWDEVIRDLSSLRAVTVQLAGHDYLMRSPLEGCAGKVLAAVGVRPPPLVQPT